jgi:hypothetical protein
MEGRKGEIRGRERGRKTESEGEIVTVRAEKMNDRDRKRGRERVR